MARPSAVLYLDVDDEITTAAARIRSADATRVALVVPPGSRIATSRINFRLLAREAIERNRRLSIVAPDAASRALAASAGLPVFGSVGEFETAELERAAGSEGSGGAGATAGAGAAGKGAAVVGTAVVVDDAAAERADRSAGARGTPATAETVVAPPAAVTGATSPGGRQVAPATDDRRPVGGSVPVSPGLIGAGFGGWPVERVAVVGAIALLVVLVLAVAGFVLLPSATITVRPRVDSLGPIALSVTADPSATTIDAASGVIPAQSVHLPLSVSDTFPATGQRIAQTAATGTVTFTSQNTFIAVTVARGTRLSTTSGVAFTTTQQILIPRASFATGPSSKDAPISAVAPGPSGNVEAGTITQEPSGLRTLLVSVANADPTTGGQRQTFPKIVQKDVDSAVAALQSRLRKELATQAADPSQTPQGRTAFPATASLSGVAPTSDPTVLVGQEVASFQLTFTGTGTFTAVDESPLRQLATDRLRASVASDHDLVPDSIAVTVGQPTTSGAIVTFPLDVSASQVRRVDPAAVRSAAKGRSLADARAALAPFGDVQITLWPDWVGSITSIDQRLDVRVEAGSAVETPSGSPGPGSSSRPGAGSTPASSGASPGAASPASSAPGSAVPSP